MAKTDFAYFKIALNSKEAARITISLEDGSYITGYVPLGILPDFINALRSCEGDAEVFLVCSKNGLTREFSC